MVLPVLAAAGIGAAGNIIGGYMGNKAAEEDREAAAEMQRRALAQYEGLDAPSLNYNLPGMPEYQALTDINYQAPELMAADFSSVGEFDPQMQQQQQMGPTAMAGISTDAGLRAAQMQALEKMQNVAEEGGMTTQDRFRMEQIAQDEARREKGSRDALAQNMQARGISGSGLELARMLGAQEGANERRAMADLGVQAGAEQRALEAIMQSGNLAGNIRGQEFGEKSDVAQAQDAVSRFNTGLRADQQAANTAALNEAQRYNMETARSDIQNLADINNQNAEARSRAANLGMDANRQAEQYTNQQLSDIYNIGVDRVGNQNRLAQQEFGNQFDIAQGQAGALGAQGQNLQRSAQDTANRYVAGGQALSQAAGTYADYKAEEEKNKLKYGA